MNSNTSLRTSKKKANRNKMNCCEKINKFLKRGIKNETTGSYLNYYLLKISEPEITKIVHDKLLVNWN